MRATCPSAGQIVRSALAVLIVTCCAAARAEGTCALWNVLGEPGVTATAAQPSVLAAADLDGDGYDELLMAEAAGSRIAIYARFLAAAGGTRWGFVRVGSVNGFNQPAQIVVRDFDSDGLLDLAVATRSSDGLVLCRGTRASGGLGFTTPSPLSGTSDARGVVAADFNHDGILDLVVTCTAGVVQLRGHGTGGGVGNGEFDPPAPVAPTGTWTCLAAGDLNRDGALDLIGCTNSPNRIQYVMGAAGDGGGNGVFGNVQIVANQSAADAIQLVDMNGDGKLDVLLPGISSGAAVAMNRTPDRVFTLTLTPVSFGSDPGEPPSLAFGAADLDGDGVKDLLFSRGSRASFRLARGALDGELYAINGTWDVPATASPSAMLVRDFDRDGVEDVALVSRSEERLSLYRGTCSREAAGFGYLGLEAIGPGTTGSNPAAGLLPLGTAVTLTASPSPGAVFAGWSGAATGSQTPLATTVTGHGTATAWFATTTHALDVSVDGVGTVQRSPALDVYPDESVVKLMAVPGPHERFAGWTGDFIADSAGVSVAMTGDVHAAAHFTPMLYSLTLFNQTGGTGASFVLDPPGGLYPFGTPVSVTAVPAPGVEFEFWIVNGVQTLANPITVLVRGDTTLSAQFRAKYYWPEIATIGFGEVFWWGPMWGSLLYGDTLNLRAVPAEGYEFAGWSGDVVDTARLVRLVVTEVPHVVAHFTSSPSYAAHIVSVRDVALDQGGRVKVSWKRSEYDQAGSVPGARVGEYRVWRGISESDALASVSNGEAHWMGDDPAPSEGRPLRRIRYFGQPTYWEWVGTVPAVALEGYGMVVSTQHDATPSRPDPWVRTFVQAVSKDSTIWWNSPIDSGLSRDNVPPDPPSAPVLQWLTSEYELRWTPSTAGDLAGYRVDLGEAAGFVADSTTFAAFTQEARIRVPILDGRARVARVRAIDVHENESAALEVVPPTLGVEAVPVEMHLRIAGANPIRGAVTVVYTLDRAIPAELRLFDVGGRLLASRSVAGVVGAGGPVTLSPPRPLAAGLYFVTLQQGGRVLRARAVVIP